jgi:glycosyltransferase involved in cell wall biosynthesis
MDTLLQKLTLAIPIYNEGAYLRKTIESCLGQAGVIILYDNASTDGSSEICAEFAAAHPGAVLHVRREQNIGAFDNFKAPLTDCKTEYFCWIGGHDLIAPGYTLHLVRRHESDPGIALAAGTIQHIDEQGAERNKPTRSTFLETGRESQPLDRLDALVRHLRDCFIFHGVYRTETLRSAWFDQPCLGFDRILLFRVAALGRLAYVPEAVIYGRDFVKDRDSKKDRERRSEVIGRHKIAKTNFTRNQQLVLTCLGQATDDATLTQALDIVERIRRRHHERRKYQRRRLKLAVAGLAILFLFALLLVNRS